MTALHTPPPGTPKTISGTQTFNPPSLDGLIQPKAATLIFSNGGQQLSEAGPIRTHSRQAAKERPSPVVFDGKRSAHWSGCCDIIGLAVGSSHL